MIFCLSLVVDLVLHGTRANTTPSPFSDSSPRETAGPYVPDDRGNFLDRDLPLATTPKLFPFTERFHDLPRDGEAILLGAGAR
jgi:hypothetical protein